MTKPSRRYLFVVPDNARPVGGQTILYDMVETLFLAGYPVGITHGRRHYRYGYAETQAPIFCNPRQARPLRWRPEPVLTHLRDALRERRTNPPLPDLRRMPGDVFVLPEFAYPEYAAAYPDAPHLVVAQDVFGLLRAYCRDKDRLFRRLAGVVTTSQASTRAARLLLAGEPHMLPLPLDAERFRPRGDKKLQIVYMPRKRPEESRLVATALGRHPALADVPILPLQGISNEARDQMLRESLIFLSFSQQEGFGLPPAEAMAAECLVIGYSGVGGEEYFTPDNGFPIADSDVTAFIETVARVVTDYRAAPEELDRLRKRAAAHIRDTYTPDAFRRGLLEIWSGFASGPELPPF